MEKQNGINTEQKIHVCRQTAEDKTQQQNGVSLDYFYTGRTPQATFYDP